jgi:PKD repeat protein
MFYGNGTDLQGTFVGGTHNVAGELHFLDPAHGNYRLGEGSAAIDSGSDTGLLIDYDDEIRPLDSGFDIGFDEANYIAGLDFSYTPAPIALAAEPVSFTATVTHGTGTDYIWDFGDGDPAAADNPVVHAFAAPGKYTVMVTASNSSDMQTAVQMIEIQTTEIEDNPQLLYLPLVIR